MGSPGRRTWVVLSSALAVWAASWVALRLATDSPVLAGADAPSPAVLDVNAATPDNATDPATVPPSAATSSQAEATFPVRVRIPAQLPGVETGFLDTKGRPVTVSCAVCHSIIDETRAAARLGKDSGNANIAEVPPETILELRSLTGFHKGMTLEHGNLTCFSCHDPDDYEGFRLADGRPVAPAQVIDLCSQCHGPQRASFDRGAHGGMTGYWDLRLGPRDRNTCTDCHRGHRPRTSQVLPVPRSIDRFLEPPPRPREDSHAG